MKVLVATSKGDDYLSSCIYDGMSEVCNIDNVYTAQDVPSFRPGPANPCQRISGYRPVYNLMEPEDKDFDLLVLCSAFTRDHCWTWANDLRTRLKPGGKIVYCEGWDDAHEVHIPAFHCDAIFRRELDPSYYYPYKCEPLSFAAPARWFAGAENAERQWDVFFAGDVRADPARWDMLAKSFSTQTQHRSLLASQGVGMDQYFDMLRHSKLALCPPGAAQSVPLRAFEIVACGAIPIFIGLPEWKREPWFRSGIDSFVCNYSTASLPDVIDYALHCDLDGMRKHLISHARQHHTTAARARKILQSVGL